MSLHFRISQATGFIVSLAFVWTAAYATQDPPKDDALDQLLQKLEGNKTPDPAQPGKDKDSTKPNAPKSEAKKETPAKAKKDDQAPSKDGPADKAKAKASPSSGTVSTQDQALDNLLEKLGTTTDTPSPDDRPRGPAQPAEKPAPKRGKGQGEDKPSPGDLKGQSKELDEHLEELLGRRKKKKQQEEEEDENSPLGKVVKEMREVEGRLGKPDTGEETRKKQAEIVKNLDGLIEQMRRMSSSSQSRSRRMRMAMQQGQRQGQQNNGQEGANAGGVGLQKPAKPDGKRGLGIDKDIWGHLPDDLRELMENVIKEEPLPSRHDLIRKYYIAVSKKSLVREE
jgi:hypothetical protein